MSHLASHDTPVGFPRFGYMLQAEGTAVGVILLISTTIRTDGDSFVRCNLSSWYVADAFRFYGSMLISRALGHREATYFNLTAVPHTFAILQAQGFSRYCEGRLMTVPTLSPGRGGAIIEAFSSSMSNDGLTDPEMAILRTHAGYGCISLVCRHGGETFPFVFAPRRKFGIAGLALLAYCRDVAEFVRFANPIGRRLLRYGLVLVAVDADGPIRGLVGHFSPNKPKFYRGEHRPRPGDMVYSERTMFGS